jgi:hypothetical protein
MGATWTRDQRNWWEPVLATTRLGALGRRQMRIERALLEEKEAGNRDLSGRMGIPIPGPSRERKMLPWR